MWRATSATRGSLGSISGDCGRQCPAAPPRTRPGAHGRAARARVETARAGESIGVLAATVFGVAFVLERSTAGYGLDRVAVASAAQEIVDEPGFRGRARRDAARRSNDVSRACGRPPRLLPGCDRARAWHARAVLRRGSGSVMSANDSCLRGHPAPAPLKQRAASERVAFRQRRLRGYPSPAPLKRSVCGPDAPGLGGLRGHPAPAPLKRRSMAYVGKQ